MRYAVAVLGLVGIMGCASSGATQTEPATTALRIDNRNRADAIVYLVRNGTAVRRLADVPSLSVSTARIPERQLTEGTITLQVRLMPGGSTASFSTRLAEDRVALLVIEPNIVNSSLSLVPGAR